VILDDLRQKDAVLFLPNAKKKLFAAKSPQDIFDMATKRMNQASMNLPLLNQLARESKDKAMVTYYEGKTGYNRAMQYKEKEIADEGELLCYLASPEKIASGMLPSINALLERLKKRGVKIRGFASDNRGLDNYRKEDKDFNREVKILPPDIYKAYSSIDISNTFVRFTLFEQEMFVIIDNPEIARIMRQIFEMNWKKY
jgi:sugar-specific transcriptional regulator TrmB